MNATHKNWYALRWAILNRDNFTCQYCGQQAPNVMLTVDHKLARTNGGTDEEDNLITACSACNTGKSTTSLGTPSKPLLIPKVKKSSLLDDIIAYLSANPDGATGTEIAKATLHNRANTSHFLHNSELFHFKGKKGRNAVYSLK